MAKPVDNTLALAAGAVALVGLGVLAGAAMAGGFEVRRTGFVQKLRSHLQLNGIDLITATLGREVDDRPVWVLSLQLPNQHVTTVRAPLDSSDDPLSDITCGKVAERIANHFFPRPRDL